MAVMAFLVGCREDDGHAVRIFFGGASGYQTIYDETLDFSLADQVFLWLWFARAGADLREKSGNEARVLQRRHGEQ